VTREGDFETNIPLQNSVGLFQKERSDLRKERLEERGGEGTVVWGGHDGFLLGCSYLTTNTEVSYLFIIAIEIREGWPY
jgi:hypothetical protein